MANQISTWQLQTKEGEQIKKRFAREVMGRSLETASNHQLCQLKKEEIEKMIKKNQKGFTLIELMIVIAIIGILAAIAIPNFIAYRNKSFCSRAESDANNIAASIADYFSIASHAATPTLGQLNNNNGFTFTGSGATINTGTIVGADPNNGITITVTDGSTRCPAEYQTKVPGWASGVFTKRIQP